MARVKRISPIGKKGARVSIELEGSDALIMAAVLAVERLRIKEGDDLDENAKSELIFQSAVIEGFEKAVKYVLIRPRSEKEVKLFLLKGTKRLGGFKEDIFNSESFSSSDVELERVERAILNKLKEYHYIDDAIFADTYINHYKSCKGQKVLRYELKQLGVSTDIINDAFLDFEGQKDEAFNLAEKWIRGKAKVDFYKLNGYLYSKGFLQEDIKDAIERLKLDINDKEDFSFYE